MADCCRALREALVLTGIAGLTDWLDGYSARKLGVSGKLGVILDPLADKLMLVTLFFALAYVHLISLWLLLAGNGARCGYRGGCSAAPHFARSPQLSAVDAREK